MGQQQINKQNWKRDEKSNVTARTKPGCCLRPREIFKLRRLLEL